MLCIVPLLSPGKTALGLCVGLSARAALSYQQEPEVQETWLS